MSTSQAITGLKLDAKSRNVLKRIKRKRQLGDLLATAITTGVFSNIFTKNSLPVALYNITQTDWELYAEAMKAVPIISKMAMRKEVELMIINYEINYDKKHLRFWKGMYHGCKK